LASTNALGIDDAVLVKMTVLEYVEVEFFNALVDTVDPATGRSLLLAELVTEQEHGDADASELVATYRERLRLVSFVKTEPAH